MASTAVTMTFKSALSTRAKGAEAVKEVCEAVSGLAPDLALVFVSHSHKSNFEALVDGVREGTNVRNLIGCTGESVIGPTREVERAPGLVVWAAKLPGVKVLPFVVDQDDISSFEEAEQWHERAGVRPEARPSFVVLPDPFSIDVERALEQMDGSFPGATIVGGMASGASEPGQNRLFLNDQVLKEGLVGISLSGPIKIQTLVSQGCRPIGEPFVVTKADHNVIFELRGRPALEVLKGVLDGADPRDQKLVQDGGLHVGTVIDEHLSRFKPGDFLIRSVMGVTQTKGVAVGTLIRAGQTVQFHVRDAATADEEMRSMLADKAKGGAPAGGLLFSCNGRGTRMFESEDHDIGLVNQAMKECQVAGFFAAGEIGPVGKRTFVHGFTSSLILFRGEGKE